MAATKTTAITNFRKHMGDRDVNRVTIHVEKGIQTMINADQNNICCTYLREFSSNTDLGKQKEHRFKDYWTSTAVLVTDCNYVDSAASHTHRFFVAAPNCKNIAHDDHKRHYERVSQ
jgi:hypothetical protein